ncbi:hypothetical protein DRO32_01025 [Candidatus Bathyarchaeota archaeon]|nr:MAG: hypothetical protein DRO32_01025 [Candidatus Bathyarchaeota archaeon]
MGRERDELEKLRVKLGHILDDRDRLDRELRKLKASAGPCGGPGAGEEIREARELLKRLEKTREEVDELIIRASSVLDKLRAMSIWRRAAAAFGGFLIFIGAMAITTGLFTVFLGIFSDLMAPEVAELLGVVGIGLGALLVLSGFAHQLP